MDGNGSLNLSIIYNLNTKILIEQYIWSLVMISKEAGLEEVFQDIPVTLFPGSGPLNLFNISFCAQPEGPIRQWGFLLFHLFFLSNKSLQTNSLIRTENSVPRRSVRPGRKAASAHRPGRSHKLNGRS